jgi:hypothetical protein
MIARLWRGRAADATKADAYVQHFTGTVTANSRASPGIVAPGSCAARSMAARRSSP